MKNTPLTIPASRRGTLGLFGVGLALLIGLCAPPAGAEDANSGWRDLPLTARIERVQPMTGIVLWSDSDAVATDAVQLEFSYVPYDRIVNERGEYDWARVDRLLAAAAERGHQMVIRFWYVYPGHDTAVPGHIKALPSYTEKQGRGDGRPTWYPDWSSAALQHFTLDFYTAFAERYDDDARLAFLQTGFGLWAEYHIYDGPFELGVTFPSNDFQARFYRHLDAVLTKTPWMMSVDCSEPERGPLAHQPELLQLGFGVFDDSLLCKQHDRVNAADWRRLGAAEHAALGPHGGEFSYYTQHDQRHALDPQGPHGMSIEQAAQRYALTFVIGNDQPRYTTLSRIAEAGMAMGYRFRVTRYQTDGQQTRGTIENVGTAPIYYDAYPALGGRRSEASLKGLLPGESRDFTIDIPPTTEHSLTIACDRLVTGQTIGYQAELE